MNHICKTCSKTFFDKRKEAKFCSTICYWKSLVGKPRSDRREKIFRGEYLYIYVPNHPSNTKQGYVAEHRLVMEKHIGRFLNRIEVVHHKNHITTDNRIENLELFASPGQHTKLAHPEIAESQRGLTIIEKKCVICKKTFEVTFKKKRRKTCSEICRGELTSSYMKGTPSRNPTGLALGWGWNKGKPMTWSKKGKEHHAFKHGRYSKHV